MDNEQDSSPRPENDQPREDSEPNAPVSKAPTTPVATPDETSLPQRSLGRARTLQLRVALPLAAVAFVVALASIPLLDVHVVLQANLGAGSVPVPSASSAASVSASAPPSVTGTATASATPAPTGIPTRSDAASSATVTFWTASQYPLNEFDTVRVSTDGSGLVQATPLTVSVAAGDPGNVGQAVLDAQATYPNTGGGPFYVPDTCTQQTIQSRQTAQEAVDAKLNNLLTAQSEGPLFVSVTTDDASAICIPSAGYQQPAFFHYAVSESATASGWAYRTQDVIDAQLARLRAMVPPHAHFTVVTRICTAQDILSQFVVFFANHPPYFDFTCEARGQAAFDWTPSAWQQVAATITGTDPRSAQTVLNATPGVLGAQISLSGGYLLPTDPSRIYYKLIPAPLGCGC